MCVHAFHYGVRGQQRLVVNETKSDMGKYAETMNRRRKVCGYYVLQLLQTFCLPVILSHPHIHIPSTVFLD